MSDVYLALVEQSPLRNCYSRLQGSFPQVLYPASIAEMYLYHISTSLVLSYEQYVVMMHSMHKYLRL